MVAWPTRDPPQAMGLDQQQQFRRYHRVLSRAKWSSGEASRVLSELLVGAFMPEGSPVVGVDETLERRQGKKIAYSGPCRSFAPSWPTPSGTP